MQITVAGCGDLTLGPGTHLSDIDDHAAQHGAPPGDGWWCGPRRIAPHHPAGSPPLVHGALLTRSPGPVTWQPNGPHLAAMAGPDAGMVVELGGGALVVGRHGDVTVADPAMSARHFAINATGDTVTDLGSTNGTWTSWWPRVRHRVTPGSVVRSGTTMWQWRPCPATAIDAPLAPMTQQALAAVITSVVAGAMMGAMTGSLLFVAAGLVLPARVITPHLMARRGHHLTTWTGDWDPSGGAPWSEPPPGTLAVTGPPELANGFARAVMIARRAGCADWSEDWVRWLPVGDRIAVMAPDDDPPRWATTVATVGPATTEMRTGAHTLSVATAAVSLANADAAARRVAHAMGKVDIATHVRWGDLDRVAAGFGVRHMRVPLGVGESGTHTLDLDRDGPHLLIAGARRSGKSTLLETIGLSLAYDNGPRDLQVLVVDCAEGAGPRRLDHLPHVTHLLKRPQADEIRAFFDMVERAVSAREQALAQTYHSSFADWETGSSAPPRILVVVDDFHCLLSEYPPVSASLVRLANQSRRVGVHLVLATGSPTGAISSDLRASASISIALRVGSPSHSMAMIGTDQAALISPHVPGRAVVCHDGSRSTVQTALPYLDPTPLVRRVGETSTAGATDLADRVIHRWTDAPVSPSIDSYAN